MSLPAITFTGIDETTSADWIKSIGRKYVNAAGYSAAEFAILRSPKVGLSPRYPSREAIRKITSYVYPGQLAFHLCGRYARMVHSLEWRELCDLIDFSLVNRVQVNSTECDEKAIVTLQRFSRHIGKPVVMQWRGDVFPFALGVDLLQDRSGGQGVAETNWSKPDDLCRKVGARIGYAGGLNPDNLKDQLYAIIRVAGRNEYWLDCESGVRTNDWFDTAKAEAMLDVLVAHTSVRKVEK